MDSLLEFDHALEPKRVDAHASSPFVASARRARCVSFINRHSFFFGFLHPNMPDSGRLRMLLIDGTLLVRPDEGDRFSLTTNEIGPVHPARARPHPLATARNACRPTDTQLITHNAGSAAAHGNGKCLRQNLGHNLLSDDGTAAGPRRRKPAVATPLAPPAPPPPSPQAIPPNFDGISKTLGAGDPFWAEEDRRTLARTGKLEPLRPYLPPPANAAIPQVAGDDSGKQF